MSENTIIEGGQSARYQNNNLYHNTLSKSLSVCLYVISLVNKQIHVALPCKYLINLRHKYLINLRHKLIPEL